MQTLYLSSLFFSSLYHTNMQTLLANTVCKHRLQICKRRLQICKRCFFQVIFIVPSIIHICKRRLHICKRCFFQVFFSSIIHICKRCLQICKRCSFQVIFLLPLSYKYHEICKYCLQLWNYEIILFLSRLFLFVPSLKQICKRRLQPSKLPLLLLYANVATF